jgi:hypothetical protein
MGVTYQLRGRVHAKVRHFSTIFTVRVFQRAAAARKYLLRVTSVT